jgi:mRNA interferase MazF
VRRAGQVAIVRFPTVVLAPGKPRPVLLLAPAPGPYDDWLVCMLSTQLQQAVEGFDEVIDPDHSDFQSSGLKVASVIRLARLAVVSEDLLVGAIGEISPERLQRIRQKLAGWIQGTGPSL